MSEPRFSSAHTHSWAPHRDPTTTKSKPPRSSHIASSHWVTGTLSKARGKRVVKNVSLRELLSRSGSQLTTARQRASTQMYFWGAPIGWVHSMKTGFFRSSLGAEWFKEWLIFEQSFELLNVPPLLFLHTHINNKNTFIVWFPLVRLKNKRSRARTVSRIIWRFLWRLSCFLSLKIYNHLGLIYFEFSEAIFAIYITMR